MKGLFFSKSFKAFYLVSLILFTATFSFFASAKDPVYTGVFNNLAVSGYDTVSYFSAGAPVKGSEAFVTEWQGAEWRFSSAENMAKFKLSPEEFAPHYGGYCAYAAASGKAVKSDPEAWDIVEGKLYLNYNKKIQKKWQEDRAGYIEKADSNWPGLLN